MEIILTLTLFFIKHFLFDFVWHTEDEIANKGVYLNWNGITHSIKHGLGTAIIVLCIGLSVDVCLLFGLADAVIHYHIDWAKSKLSQGLSTIDNKFWVLLGLDQLLHYLTYLFFVIIIVIL